MRLTMVRFAVFTLALAALAIPSPAVAGGWFDDMGEAKEVTLGDVLRSPKDYVDVDVKMKVYFNTTGDSYNPYFTRFTEEMYGNFSAWPIDARLYDRRDYQRSFPFLFVARHNKQWKKLQALKRVTAIEITASVGEVFRGQPWILVHSFRTLGEGLRAADVRHVVAGDAYYLAGRYDEAVNHYAKATGSRLHGEIRAEVYRKLGDAQFRSGDARDALRSYQTALAAAPDSAVLQRGVAAAAAAVAQAKGKEVSENAPAAPAPSDDPVLGNSSNDVDEIIRMLEDPAKVAADVAAWRAELEKRAELVRSKNAPETVASTPEKSESEEQPVEAAAPEEQPEAAAAPSEEGCGESETVEKPAQEETEGVKESADVPAQDDGTAQEEGQGSDEEKVAEQPAEGTEGCGEEVDEETHEGEAEQPAEQEVVEEPKAEEQPAEQETAEEPKADEQPVEQEVVEGEEAVVEQNAEGDAESVVVVEDPHVVRVGDQTVSLPRLPFFGCDGVTVEDLRVVIEEVLRHPDS